jgi:pimeloyl-ACP methyl ester carboxylesterase
MSMDLFERSDTTLELAGSLALRLGTATPMSLRPQDKGLLADAEAFGFGSGLSRQAWSIGDGPVVLLVHGYGGRGVQMAALARRVAALGFRAVLFDAGGHGDSRAEKIGFFTFINDTADIAAHLGKPIFAMIGHSAGALAMMRARALHAVAAERYVVIAAPLYPYVPLESMQARGAPDDALAYVKAILSDQFRTTWTSLVEGVAYDPEKDKPLLAVYDKSDERVRHADAERIAARWPGTSVVLTEGFGHNRILQAEETLEAVSRFLV